MTGKWLGRCPACGAWGSLVEERSIAPAPGVRGAQAAGRPLLRLVEVETADPLPVQLDGEQPGTAPVRFEIEPAAFRLRVPAS